ncbi:DUF4302 domain-containing protein [Dyadobacter sp. CY261]|uniref:DUF4302 domain-containing protein n=1 Tax=Dyadobacter sp. CY261 TaxID=2907203 RepID=UPI001F278E91|nr:DUF4302 domain-containing protein [Dyadobacter sp. CY261]MCF0073425.1 DUF4302 domain-containing protein [Dyadobacter sp. CY261]
MKNSLLYLLFLTTVFFSCENKDDTVFEESADVRLNAALASYEKQLVEAPYGWNAIIYPGGGGSYGFYFKFDDKNRVTMYSDFSDAAAAKSKESSYRLKAMQTPSLIFDTYSYLHVLADPDEEVNNGVRGEGLKSDFEFSIYSDSVKTDVITLVGRKNQSRLVLTKATQAQATAYTNGDLAKALLFNNIAKYIPYFKRVTLGANTYEITVNQDTRTIKMTWLNGNVPKTFSTSYYMTPGGVAFTSALVNGSQTITGFSNITWNANSTQLGVSGGGASGVVVSAIKPISVDLAAARRWWQAPVESGGDWRSENGFHVNGVDDAFKVKDLKYNNLSYAFYMYAPAFNSRYDAFAPIFYDEDGIYLEYGHAPAKPTFTADGRVVFTEFGAFGDIPVGGAAEKSGALLFDTSGFYLIQTSDETYDMVSAKDAKSWITWE